MSADPRRIDQDSSVSELFTRVRALERKPAAAGGSGVPFAGFGQSGPTSVPSGVSTPVPLSPGNLYTSDASVFAAASGGIEILAAGFYKAFWTVQLFDRAGHRVANPSTFVITAGEGGSNWDITGMLYGQQNTPGFSTLGIFAEWDIIWMDTAGVGPLHTPQTVIITVSQSTGETLDAYASLHIEQLSTDPLGFDY